MPCFERTKISTKHSGCLSEASNFRHPFLAKRSNMGHGWCNLLTWQKWRTLWLFEPNLVDECRTEDFDSPAFFLTRKKSVAAIRNAESRSAGGHEYRHLRNRWEKSKHSAPYKRPDMNCDVAAIRYNVEASICQVTCHIVRCQAA